MRPRRTWFVRLTLVLIACGGGWLWIRERNARAEETHHIEIRPLEVSKDRDTRPSSLIDRIPGSHLLQGVPSPKELLAPLTRGWSK